jgi:flap endonuclease-1
MGVTGGTKNIMGGYIPNKLNLRHITNYTESCKLKVVIDAYSVMNRYTIGSLNTGKYIVDKYGNKIMEIYYLLIIAIRFLSIGILPVFVFDGCAPDLKSDTIEKRRQSKDKAEQILEQIKTSGSDSNSNEHTENMFIDIEQESIEHIDTELIKYLKRSYRPNITNVQRAKLLLGYMGIPVIDSPGEADPQCAAIASVHTDVIGVITDDFDALMFMSPNILRMSSLGSNTLEEYTLQSTLDHLHDKIIHIINHSTDDHLKSLYFDKQFEITHDNLREICCLMGTDYCPGLKLKFNGQDKFEQLLELYVLNDMSIEKVLNSMSDNLNDSYITRMMNSINAYKNAEVLDPRELNITMRKPSIDMVRNNCAEFLHKSEVDKICNLLTKLYNDESHSKVKYDCYSLNNKSKPNQKDVFGSFASYKIRYMRERERKNLSTHDYSSNNIDTCYGFTSSSKSWPEAMYSIPIR